MTERPAIFRAYLPMNRYRLRLEHCLLSELGAISHAVIRGMGIHELAYADVARVIGLGEAQLAPVVRRLTALDVLDADGSLSPRGQLLAAQLASSHQRVASVWLGAYTRGPLLLVRDGVAEAQFCNQSGTAGGECRDRGFPSHPGRAAGLQRARLQASMHALLSACFPSAAQSVISRETSARDWDVQVECLPDEQTPRFLPLDVPLASLTFGQGTAMTLACESARLGTRYAAPAGLPAGLSLTCPGERRWYFDHAEGRTVDEEDVSSAWLAEPSRFHVSWPSVSESDRMGAARRLLSIAAEDCDVEVNAFSRSLSFEAGFIARGLDWGVLQGLAGDIPGVHVLGAR